MTEVATKKAPLTILHDKKGDFTEVALVRGEEANDAAFKLLVNDDADVISTYSTGSDRDEYLANETVKIAIEHYLRPVATELVQDWRDERYGTGRYSLGGSEDARINPVPFTLWALMDMRSPDRSQKKTVGGFVTNLTLHVRAADGQFIAVVSRNGYTMLAAFSLGTCDALKLPDNAAYMYGKGLDDDEAKKRADREAMLTKASMSARAEEAPGADRCNPCPASTTASGFPCPERNRRSPP